MIYVTTGISLIVQVISLTVAISSVFFVGFTCGVIMTVEASTIKQEN